MLLPCCCKVYPKALQGPSHIVLALQLMLKNTLSSVWRGDGGKGGLEFDAANACLLNHMQQINTSIPLGQDASSDGLGQQDSKCSGACRHCLAACLPPLHF